MWCSQCLNCRKTSGAFQALVTHPRNVTVHGIRTDRGSIHVDNPSLIKKHKILCARAPNLRVYIYNHIYIEIYRERERGGGVVKVVIL